MSKLKRRKSLWSSKTAALTPSGQFTALKTPSFTNQEIAELPEHAKKGAVLYYIEALHRRIEQQQNAIGDLKRVIAQREAFISECKRAFSELGPLLPSRPNKGAK